MTNPMRLLYPLLLSLSLASPAQTVFVDLNRAEPDIVVGQPPIVLLELRSSTAATVDLGPNRLGYLEFDVIDPFGAHSVLRPEVPDFSTTDPIALAPGVPYRQRINLAPLLQPLSVGSYSIGVKVADSYAIGEISVGRASTNLKFVFGAPASIRVGPRDARQLKEVAGALRVEIENATSARERIEAASELSSINDPVAVADVRALLGRGLGVDDQLIAGLEQIGSSGAIDALQASLSNPDPMTAKHARSTIMRIEATTKDDAIRAYAKEALRGK